MKDVILSGILCLLLLITLACGFPSEEKVMSEFKEANPTFTPLSAVVGDGHSDAAYYYVRYKKPGDERIFEQGWEYVRKEDGKIRLSGKGPETVVK